MISFKKRKKFKIGKFGVIYALIAILSVSVMFVSIKVLSNEKTKTLGSNVFTYSIGLLDESGEYEKGTSSIYTKDYYSVDGLTIELKEDADVTYKLFFFDEDKEYVSSTSDLSATFDNTKIPEKAEYFKIVITPTNDAEVSLFEVNNYAKQLTVTIDK